MPLDDIDFALPDFDSMNRDRFETGVLKRLYAPSGNAAAAIKRLGVFAKENDGAYATNFDVFERRHPDYPYAFRSHMPKPTLDIDPTCQPARLFSKFEATPFVAGYLRHADVDPLRLIVVLPIRGIPNGLCATRVPLSFGPIPILTVAYVDENNENYEIRVTTFAAIAAILPQPEFS